MARVPRKLEASMRAWATKAPLIFLGEIRALGASTVASVKPDEGLAVVRLEQDLALPAVLRGFRGRDVTVRLRTRTGSSKGTRAVFFATSLLYAEGLLVEEIGRLPGKTNLDRLRETLVELSRDARDKAIGARLGKADLVVSGQVVEVRSREAKAFPVSEHNPVWAEADIAVDTVVKGRLAKKVVTMIFPTSLDEMWLDSPRPVPGQEGVFVLQLNQTERGGPKFRAKGLTALDPLDVQPPDQLDRVRVLAKARRG